MPDKRHKFIYRQTKSSRHYLHSPTFRFVNGVLFSGWKRPEPEAGLLHRPVLMSSTNVAVCTHPQASMPCTERHCSEASFELSQSSLICSDIPDCNYMQSTGIWCGHRGSPQRGTGSAAGVNWNLVRQGVVSPNSYTVISAWELHRQCWLDGWLTASVISPVLIVSSRRYSIIKQAADLSHLLNIFLSPAALFITWMSGAFPTLSNWNVFVLCGFELCEY